MNKQRSHSSWFLIGFSFALSLAACAFIFFDLFWRCDQSFMWHHDAEIPFEDTFFLVSNFFQGGLQIFDHYDGMNFAFNHLGHGLYTVANICTAAIYIICTPFLKFPGESYHAIYGIVFHAVNMLIRTVGGYVLLRKFKISPIVTVISLVILNTFLSSTMYLGFVAENLYSYFPLLAYFIINFFEKFKCKDFIAIILLLTIAVADCPLLALGYFYQNVNFLMISACVYGLIYHHDRIAVKSMFDYGNIRSILRALSVCILIILPSLIMFKLLSTDFYVEGSGLGGTHGRLNNMFNPLKYFAPKGETILPLGDFIFKAVDFTNAAWEKSWIFLGASTLMFSLIGILCSRHKAKYIFAVTAVLVLLTNTPLDPHSLLSVAHWINVLTDPFSFLLRSYHMPVLLLPYVILPLVAFGLESCWAMIRREISSGKSAGLTALCTGFIFVSAWALPLDQKFFVLTALCIALIFLYVCWQKEERVWGINRWQWGIILLTMFMAIDVWALREYYINNQYRGDYRDRGLYMSKNDGRHLKPYVFEGFEDSRPFLLEYQNPKILPFREYFRILPTATDPHMHTFHGHYGAFYKYIPLERYFEELDIYKLRPKIYKDFALNIKIYKELAQDQRVVVFSYGGFNGPRQTLPDRIKTYTLELAHANISRQWNLNVALLKLPVDFPRHEATAIFTADRDRLSLMIDGRAFLPVQGALTDAGSFDVNNVKDGYLAVALHECTDIKGKTAQLTLKQSGDILNIWQNTDDALGFNFLATQDGWLKIRYPYDPKWEIIVDGKRSLVQRIDGYFLGTPLKSGEHKILLRYWPYSPLRILIPISMVLTIIVLIRLVIYGLNNKE